MYINESLVTELVTDGDGGGGASLEYTEGEKSALLFVLATIAVCSLVADILVNITIALTRSFHSTGYAFLVSMSFAEMICLVVTILGFFATYNYDTWRPQTADRVHEWLGYFHNISYFTLVPHLNIIAFNRFCSVKFYRQYSKWFSRRNTAALIMLAWCFGFFVNIPLLRHDTRFMYVPALLSWNYDFSKPGTFDYLQFDLACGVTTTFNCIFLYSALVISFYRMKSHIGTGAGVGSMSGGAGIVSGATKPKAPLAPAPTITQTSGGTRQILVTSMSGHTTEGAGVSPGVIRKPAAGAGGKQSKLKRDDVRLAMQFLMGSAVYVLSVVFFFTTMWTVGADKIDKWYTLAFNIAFLMNYSANPWIYLIFNAKLRMRMRRIVACKCIVISHGEPSAAAGAEHDSYFSFQRTARTSQMPDIG